VRSYASIVYDERLQGLPDWERLARDVLGIKSDAHHDDHVPEGEFGAEPAPHQIPRSTISRSVRSRPPRPVHAYR
jgi:hypothetical protein